MFSLKITHLGCSIFGTSCINFHLIINWAVIFYFDWPNPLTLFSPIFVLECSASHGVGWNRHDAYIVRNESFNKSNNFKKEFGCRMCTYIKLFACITIAKELALFKAVSTLSKNPEIQGLRTGTLSHFPKTPRRADLMKPV